MTGSQLRIRSENALFYCNKFTVINSVQLRLKYITILCDLNCINYLFFSCLVIEQAQASLKTLDTVGNCQRQVFFTWCILSYAYNSKPVKI